MPGRVASAGQTRFTSHSVQDALPREVHVTNYITTAPRVIRTLTFYRSFSDRPARPVPRQGTPAGSSYPSVLPISGFQSCATPRTNRYNAPCGLPALLFTLPVDRDWPVWPQTAYCPAWAQAGRSKGNLQKRGAFRIWKAPLFICKACRRLRREVRLGIRARLILHPHQMDPFFAVKAEDAPNRLDDQVDL